MECQRQKRTARQISCYRRFHGWGHHCVCFCHWPRSSTACLYWHEALFLEATHIFFFWEMLQFTVIQACKCQNGPSSTLASLADFLFKTGLAGSTYCKSRIFRTHYIFVCLTPDLSYAWSCRTAADRCEFSDLLWIFSLHFIFVCVNPTLERGQQAVVEGNYPWCEWYRLFSHNAVTMETSVIGWPPWSITFRYLLSEQLYMLLHEALTCYLQIQRYQNVINQGGHPIALFSMVTTLRSLVYSGVFVPLHV